MVYTWGAFSQEIRNKSIFEMSFKITDLRSQPFKEWYVHFGAPAP